MRQWKALLWLLTPVLHEVWSKRSKILLQRNGGWHSHALAAGASSTFCDSVCHMTSCSQHWDLCYTYLCDNMQIHSRDFTVDLKLMQRTNLKFSITLRKSVKEDFEMLHERNPQTFKKLSACASGMSYGPDFCHCLSMTATQNTLLGSLLHCWKLSGAFQGSPLLISQVWHRSQKGSLLVPRIVQKTNQL